MALDYDGADKILTNTLIPRDRNIQPLSVLAGIVPSGAEEGKVVPLSLKDNMDGTWMLDVNATATINADNIDIGDVVIKAILAGSADRADEAILSYVVNGANDFSLKVAENNSAAILADTTAILADTAALLVAFGGAGTSAMTLRKQADLLDASAPVATGAAFASIKTYDVQGFKTKTLVIKNTGAQDMDVQVFGSVDGGTDFSSIVLGSTNILAGGVATVANSDYYTDLDVQAKDGAGSTTIETYLAAVPV